MFVKPLTVVVMMLASTAACAAAVDESDGSDESARATADTSLALRRGDDIPQPQPLDYPVPGLPQRPDLREWDFRQIEREIMRTPVPYCELHTVKLYDPARQKEIEVGITVCP